MEDNNDDDDDGKVELRLCASCIRIFVERLLGVWCLVEAVQRQTRRRGTYQRLGAPNVVVAVLASL